jgi:hypothetical protein
MRQPDPFHPQPPQSLFPDMPATHLTFAQAAAGETLHQIHQQQIQEFTAPVVPQETQAPTISAGTLSAAYKAPLPLQFAASIGEPALPAVEHPIRTAVDTGSAVLLALVFLVSAAALFLDRRRDAKL